MSAAVPLFGLAVGLAVLAAAGMRPPTRRRSRPAGGRTDTARHAAGIGSARRVAGTGSRLRAVGARRSPAIAVVAALGRRAGWAGAARGGMDAQLAAAGSPLGLTPADLAAVKAGAALVALGVAAVWAQPLPGRLSLVALVAAPVTGFWAPDLLLARRAAARRQVLEREVADVVELLRVAVAAGLSPDRALREVAAHRGGMLGGELGRAARQIEFGVAREQALRELSARCPVEAVGALIAALRRAERHGAPVDEALAAVAAQARADRSRAAQEAGARAAPQIQLVVALVLVPAVMLLVAASLVRGLT